MELGLPNGKELGDSPVDWIGPPLGLLLGEVLGRELGSTGSAGGLKSQSTSENHLTGQFDSWNVENRICYTTTN